MPLFLIMCSLYSVSECWSSKSNACPTQSNPEYSVSWVVLPHLVRGQCAGLVGKAGSLTDTGHYVAWIPLIEGMINLLC